MISIVTPSFNQGRWLRLCLASVADQVEEEHEHIVQDSLSTDGTAEWLSRDERVQAFIEQDTGMYDALKRGFAQARGDICGYLNCDEQYLPGTLLRVAAYFRNNPTVDVLFGDALIVDAEGSALAYRRAIVPTRSHLRASHLNVFTCALFFRRRVWEAGHRIDPRWKSIGDAVWIDGMLQAGLRMAVLPELLAVFTLTGANLSTQDPRSEAEKAQWQKEIGKTSPAFCMWQTTLHRFRKLRAGAYRRRKLDYEIYTMQSPTQRVRLSAKSLGGVWPGGAAR